MPHPAKIRVRAPAELEPVQIAQAIVGNGLLVKAEPVPRYGKRTFRRYKVMLTLTDRFERAYSKQLQEMVRVMRDYIEKNILKGPLEKAGIGKPLVTPTELDALVQIIEDYHDAFIAGTVGPETLPPATVDRLIDAGILPASLKYTFDPTADELPPAAMQVIEDAYRYGHVLTAARTAKERRQVHDITYEHFVRKLVPTIPLDQRERQAIEWIKHSAAKEIKGLGNRVAADFSTEAIEADATLRRKYMGVIRDTVQENVERRESWRKLASDLGHKTGDWARDFKRIAATEKQKAMQEGQVARLVSRYGDPDDIRVAKQPNPDACPSCIKLHYEHGAGSKLRIFKLSELIDNGTNVGKKQNAWQATVGPVHPWCGCELVHVPEGWDFDEENELRPIALLRSDWLEWDLRKAGPYLGPRGGKYADPQHKIPWKDAKPIKIHGKLSPAEVIAIERLANEGGKQAGQNMEAAESRITEPHVLANVPLDELDTHFDDKGYTPSDAEKKRIAEYAALKTAPPPIRALHNARSHKRGQRKAYVANGNHRVAAARAAGRKTIEVMMPVRDFALWQKTRSALKKAQYDAPTLPYTNTLVESGIVVRVGDPRMREEIEKVIAKAPPEIFHRDVGVTLITTDIPRVQNPLDENDMAYWSGNEIRISQTLSADRIARVLPHEIGHSLNIYLIRQLGSVEAVRAWHRALDAISRDEGYVSAYAEREPIENAAEVTMNYLYHKPRLMIRWPRQFAFVHRAYRGIFRG